MTITAALQSQQLKELRQQAIEHNYAKYNPKTGAWEWIEQDSTSQD